MLLFTFCQENKSKSRSPVKIITHFFHVSTYISKYRQCWWQLWRFSTYTLKNVLWICIKHRRDRMMLEPWRDAAFYQTTKPIQTFIYYPFTQTFENQCRFTLTTNLFLGKYSNTHKHGEKTNVHTHIIKYVKCNHRMHKAKSLWERHFWIIYNVNISDNWEIEFALLNSVRDTDQLQRWWLVMRTVKWEIWPFKYLHMFVLKRAPELELRNSVFADE